jgi:hypothetical protein
VTHPDFERFNSLSEEDQLLESLSTLVRHFGPLVVRVVSEGFPEVTGPPGIRALTAPDGVTLCILRGDEDPREVRDLVMADVAERYFRPEARGMIASGASPEEVNVAAHRTLVRVRGQYRVELLGEPRPAPGGRP